ncbi:hypothetical protein CXG81DRAFT_12687 [Caulochytrium protostelioides]|uniref:Glutathione S-transferase n=1 Tax=Caulochytrium protostelioides TaxID=1555241 RepID=A0A4P9X6Q6_9FUNG|nr:hypothetical protein CXG81DRAFT_12687 [Caulochytrium protostelioides]|eukprot:RKP00887.1 hypothetical protein CXG81DRAFT_12687 [Caulochytrium protostelioides]
MTADVTLYAIATPNGAKASCMLELLGVDYVYHSLSFSKNEQKEAWYLKICPNGRIPAIVDHRNNDFAVWETGAILLYLAEHYDTENRFGGKTATERSEILQWMFFANAGVGPMQGQVNHFLHYAPEKVPYGLKRYTAEVLRLYSVLEDRLATREYLVGDRLTIADVNAVPWVRSAPYSAISLDGFPKVAAWCERVAANPAFQKGLRAPSGDSDMVGKFLSDKPRCEAAFEKSREMMKQQIAKEQADKDKSATDNAPASAITKA